MLGTVDHLGNYVDYVVLKRTRKIWIKFGYSLYGFMPKIYIKLPNAVDRKILKC